MNIRVCEEYIFKASIYAAALGYYKNGPHSATVTVMKKQMCNSCIYHPHRSVKQRKVKLRL